MKSTVTRLRRLTPGQEQRIGLLRRVARLLDSALPVPGPSFRFGLDPILGLIPGLGDLVSPLFTLGIIWQARDLGIGWQGRWTLPVQAQVLRQVAIQLRLQATILAYRDALLLITGFIAIAFVLAFFVGNPRGRGGAEVME